MDSAAPHKHAMDTYLQKELDAHGEFCNSMEPVLTDIVEKMVKAGNDGRPTAVVVQEKVGELMAALPGMQSTLHSKMTELLAAETSGLWDTYDKDKSGDLSPAEMEGLLRDYLKAMGKNVGAFADAALAPSTDLMLRLLGRFFQTMKNENPDDETLRQIEGAVMDSTKQQLQAQMSPMRPIMIRGIELVMADIDDNIQAFSNGMIEEMDKNHDGKVTRGEFEAHFASAMAAIMSPEAKIRELMGAPARQQDGGGGASAAAWPAPRTQDGSARTDSGPSATRPARQVSSVDEAEAEPTIAADEEEEPLLIPDIRPKATTWADLESVFCKTRLHEPPTPDTPAKRRGIFIMWQVTTFVTLLLLTGLVLATYFLKDEPTRHEIDKGGNPRTNMHYRGDGFAAERMAPLIEYPGAIYRSYPAVGAFGCRDACDKDARCVSWVVGACQAHKDAHQAGVCYLKGEAPPRKRCYFFAWDVTTGRCSIKTSSSGRKPDGRFISGSAEWSCDSSSLDDGWNYEGANLLVGVPSSTALECCKRCQQWNSQAASAQPLVPFHNECSSFGGISAQR